ncbi:hypothetical protein HK097_002115 [Rhizophlyctis rosea]|uniref:F-box domain-containing protein n=1 Tax=Rhizophlyctis rosea TaxID=64517 RepID=A0AAD5S3V6_9FUNG|nr:hypothetical protein HK097_002115 [Rhizophlyctis rosea]
MTTETHDASAVQALPPELWGSIFSTLPFTSFYHLSQTNSFFANLSKDTHVRAKLFANAFSARLALDAMIFDSKNRSLLTLDLLNTLISLGSIVSRAAIQFVTQEFAGNRPSLHYKSERTQIPAFHPLFVSRLIELGYQKYETELHADRNDFDTLVKLLHGYLPSWNNGTLSSTKTFTEVATFIETYHCPLLDHHPSDEKKPFFSSKEILLQLCLDPDPSSWKLLQLLMSNSPSHYRDYISHLNTDVLASCTSIETIQTVLE